VFAALTTVVGGGVAQAQDNSSLEEITVTGSRLRRDGMSSPTPVTAVGMEEMRVMAPTLLMDSLNQLPQFRENDQSQTGSIFTPSGGANAVNLRGIGSNRTLTLLNSRRLVSGQQAGTVDVAILPTALIDRVEVVTGGASAAYGSDAISGVTNFILDTDFEGVKGTLQTGQTAYGDHGNYQVEFAAGTPIGERGHFVGSVDYYHADRVVGLGDRNWGKQQMALVTRGVNAVPRRSYETEVCSRAISAGGGNSVGSARRHAVHRRRTRAARHA
jgi:outer membrane receptor protein involved in Fe transport